MRVSVRMQRPTCSRRAIIIIMPENCYDFALKAGTESVRYQFLDLTKMWVTAAQELENSNSTPHSPQAAARTHHTASR